MISIIISIRPEWVAKILNGEKTIEVRKGLALYNALKRAEERGEEVEFLMYVTKAKPYLVEIHDYEHDSSCFDTISLTVTESRVKYERAVLNGKVVARFKGDFGKVYDVDDMGILYEADGMDCDTLLNKSRLTFKQLDHYIQGKTSTFLEIRDLEIFDKPKDLADYGLKRAPESWCYSREKNNV